MPSGPSHTGEAKDTHIDERGVIKDLLVTNEYSVTSVTFTRGAVRGNHFHKETIQLDTVVKGRLLCKTTAGEGVVRQGDLLKHAPGVPHAYEALDEAELISVCIGKRRGEHYEEDTFRLEGEEKLL